MESIHGVKEIGLEIKEAEALLLKWLMLLFLPQISLLLLHSMLLKSE